jgi:hypothetical protein
MGRPIDEALAELEREAHIRLKCFDRWVEQGKLSWTDAFNRMEALLSAVKLLRDVQTAAKLAELDRTRPGGVTDPHQVEAFFREAHSTVDNATPDNLVPLTQQERAEAPAQQRKVSA